MRTGIWAKNKGSEAMSPTEVWGKSTPGRRISHAKAMGQACTCVPGVPRKSKEDSSVATELRVRMLAEEVCVFTRNHCTRDGGPMERLGL